MDKKELRELHFEQNGVVDAIDSYFQKKKNLKLVGDMDVHIYLYTSSRRQRPRSPIYQFRCSDVYRTPAIHPTMKIKGKSFKLPLKDMHESLRSGKNAEKIRRIVQASQTLGTRRFGCTCRSSVMTTGFFTLFL